MPTMRQGFSLVELSIVLVILGLLTGGILAGQSLIRAAELRAVTTEYQRYTAATNTFRDKYFALPGDMANATAVWGAATNPGNGDGNINWGAGASATGEMFEFWNQMALAGLIEGKYSGLAGPGGAIDTIPGTNSPKSKLTNAGWTVYYQGNYAGDTQTYAANYGILFILGVMNVGTITNVAVLKPEESWNIDTKLDDGKPGTGKILARENGSFAGVAATKCTTSANNTDYTGAYNLSNSGVICPLIFPQPF